MDPYLATGIGLGVFGVLFGFACWVADLFAHTVEDPERRIHQSAIRGCIKMMIENPNWNGESALHSLLDEYRHGA